MRSEEAETYVALKDQEIEQKCKKEIMKRRGLKGVKSSIKDTKFE